MSSEEVRSWFRGPPETVTAPAAPGIQSEELRTQIACLSRSSLESMLLSLSDRIPEVRRVVIETYEKSVGVEPSKRPKTQLSAEALEALCAKYQ